MKDILEDVQLMPDNSSGIFLGIRPILDLNQHIVAYELRLRSDLNVATEADSQASTRIVIQTFDELDVAGALTNKKGYIKVGTDLLLSDLIESLPPRQIVLELLESIQVDEQIIQRCRKLKTLGFTLALSNYCGDTLVEPLFDIVDIIKIDRQEASAERVKYLKQWPVKLLAGKIENTEQAIQLRELGFDLFQGYSFAHPLELHAEHTDTSKLELMKLLELVLEDAETQKIESEFKHDPTLIYNLLRLVNSASSGGRYKVGSLKQAITILGRQQIQRWLQLLLFVGKSGDMQTPLLELAATRGKLMELLAISHARMDRDLHDRAFMTGIMSLLNILLGMPFQDIFSQVSLASDVEDAILNQEGKLGKLLLLVKTAENDDFVAASTILNELRINPRHLMLAQLEAMRWANSLREEAG